MFITVSRKDIAIGRKGRIAVAAVVSVGLHALLLMTFLQQHYKEPYIPYEETDPAFDVELYQVVEPPPPPVPIVEMKPHEVEEQPPETPRETPEDKPQDQPEAKSDIAPAVKPAPQPLPEPQVQIRAKPVENVMLQKQMAKAVTQQSLSDNDLTAPTVATVPVVTPAIRAKKKNEEDTALSKTSGARALNDLELHQPSDAPAMLEAAAEPSGGQTAAGGGRSGLPSNMPSAGQLSGALKGGTKGADGSGIAGGRGKLTQAMQNHDYCNTTVEKGKSVPANCQMDALKGQGYLGLKKDVGLQRAAASVDAKNRYKTSPGSPDQWNTVMPQPSDPPNKDDQPKYGDYSSGKRQRVVGQCSLTSSCTPDGRETRKPGDPKPGG